MPMQSITLPGRRSRAEELYDHLRAAILSGELRPSERLVENTLAELASVSRTPVRQALQQLESDGLLRESKSGGMEVFGFSLDEIADLCAVRETLEGMATGLAAGACSPMELALLGGVLDAERRALQDDSAPAVQIELNHRFHETIWNASRNRYLATELRSLREMIEQRQGTTLRSAERRRMALDEHQAIVTAITNKDSEAAEQAAREHFRAAMAARLTAIADTLSSVSPA
jgi:DNA-binding GntR family transcriptional regulator